MKKIYLIIAYILTHVAYIVAQNEIVIQDDDLVGGVETTWTADNVYVLDGYVFLEDGGKLTIEPGTIIKGMSTPSSADPASALIISRGAQIFAEGTAEAPIIFTTSLDDTNDDTDLLPTDRGLWGGLVVLGKAPGGFKNEAIEFNIEGIPTEGYGDKALYGGDVSDDNSGIIRYISIRHGGAAIAPDNEINGLTLGGVGSGTTIEYVEIFANADDGIEWFGGTVNVKYMVSAFCGDEAFDYDQSWAGKGQFMFSITGDDTGERGFEIDGSEAPSLNPKTVPVFSNITQIGAGLGSPVTNND
ncbi:MAG: T9SS C-terminal target domain-containing protein, partial [Saprospiraceae bacterium]|nr:T9SS C-terminal target domain-containing protein [Saprospiraceae bacterium]